MSSFIVLLGAPGAGKGTQAKFLSEEFGLPHISSGDLFRKHLRENTELGKTAREYMNRGELVPDDVTISMVKERIANADCKDGAILDGFPRTPPQADALNSLLEGQNGKVVVVPYIQVPEDVLVERLSGRRMCREHGHVFHVKYNPPKIPDRCDYDGSELYQREDDKPEVVRNRINVYLEKTAPLIDYYRKKGVLVEIDGNKPIDDIKEELIAVVKKAIQK